MEQIIMFIISSFSDVFTLFSRFEFFGITLLEYLLALLVIGVMLPIILSFNRSVLTSSSSFAKAEIRKGKGK